MTAVELNQHLDRLESGEQQVRLEVNEITAETTRSLARYYAKKRKIRICTFVRTKADRAVLYLILMQ